MISKKIINKRILVYFLLFVSTVLFLTGCSSGGGGGGPTPTPTTNTGGIDGSKDYQLIWWNLFEEEETVNVLIEAYKAKFKEQYPGSELTIDYVQVTDGLEDDTLIASYRDKLDENLLDNEPLDTPDIITIHNSWLGRYQSRLVSSSNITSSEVQQSFFPVITQDFIRSGRVYALPMAMDSLALVANVELMSEVSSADSAGPENTWFDLLDQATRVTKTEGNEIKVAGFAGGLDNVEFLPDIVSLIMMQNEVQMTETDSLSGFPSAAVFASNPESEVSMDYFRSFYQGRKTWDQTFTSEIAAFLSGKLSMLIIPSWRLNDILRLIDLYGLDINPEVFPVPQVNPGSPDDYVNWATYWGLAVTKDSFQNGRSEVAWDFIKFLTEEEQLRTFNTSVSQRTDRFIDILYPRMTMATEQKTDTYIGAYATALETAQTWDMVDGFLVRQLIREDYGQSGNPDADSLQNDINNQVISKRTTLLTE